MQIYTNYSENDTEKRKKVIRMEIALNYIIKMEKVCFFR